MAGKLELELDSSFSSRPPRDIRDEVLEHGERALVGMLRGWELLLEQKGIVPGASDLRPYTPPHPRADRG